jgi:hypothetical protein
MTDKCPKCGAFIGYISDHDYTYRCGRTQNDATGELSDETATCLRRQLAAVTRERDIAVEAVRIASVEAISYLSPCDDCGYLNDDAEYPVDYCNYCQGAFAYALAEAAWLEQHAPDELMTAEEMKREVEAR